MEFEREENTKEFFIVEDRPKVFTNREIAQKVDKYRLIGRVNIDNTLLASAYFSENELFDQARQKLVYHFADELVKKVDFSTFREPLLNNTVIEGEVITMTQKDLYDLLTELGVKIEVKK